MKVIVVGGSGTIGQAIVAALRDKHTVLSVGRRGGDLRADMADSASLASMFEAAAPYDAVICAAGEAVFRPLAELEDRDFELGLNSKLMGQVNLVRLGAVGMSDDGSFTLTSGVLSQHPVPGSASISLVNAGVEAFARAAALELPRGIRINVVSPPWVRETLQAMGMDPAPGLAAAIVAQAYVTSLEGEMSGRILDPVEHD